MCTAAHRPRRGTRRLARLMVAGLAIVATTAGAADTADAALSVRSCVGADTLELGVGDERAMLDEADRNQVAAAMLERYPMLARDAFAPTAIVLWRKPGGDWLYVALAPPPQRPPAWCFSATFVAQAFKFTPALLQKYFFVGSART